jgi:hypothetical protein
MVRLSLRVALFLRATLPAVAMVAAVACSNASDDATGGAGSAGVAASNQTGGTFGAGATAGNGAQGGAATNAGRSGSAGAGATGGAKPAMGGSAGVGGAALGGGGGATNAGAPPQGGTSSAGGNGAAGAPTATGGAAGTAAAGASGRNGGGGANSGGGAGASGAAGRGAGGASAGGAGGSGGSGGYQACPASPCKIMPFGDSITFGVGDEGNGGYRGPLFASIAGAGQKVTFTGSLSNGPTTVANQSFPKRNEGHSGWGITEVTPYSGSNAGIATVIPNPGFSSGSGGVPDIILLHIGTNDQGSLSAMQMTSDLSTLLDKLITNAPNAYIVVAQIIPLGYGDNSVIKAYNQSIPGLVQTRASAGKHITSVDMFTGFAQNMLGSDDIHPNAAGYTFMAEHWYSVIGSLLPE